MIKRNEIAYPAAIIEAPEENEIVAAELQQSAKIIAIAYSEMIMHLSDSNLDQTFEMCELISMMTNALYCNDQTTSFMNAWEEMINDDDFLHFIDNMQYLNLPIAKYFDFA